MDMSHKFLVKILSRTEFLHMNVYRTFRYKNIINAEDMPLHIYLRCLRWYTTIKRQIRLISCIIQNSNQLTSINNQSVINQSRSKNPQKIRTVL